MKKILTTLLITLTITACSSNEPTVQTKKSAPSKPLVMQKKAPPKSVVVQSSTKRLSTNENETKKYYEMGKKYWGQNNFVEALVWLKKASDAGNQDANIDIGRIYEDGKGSVATNHTQAAKYYSLGARNGDHSAQYRLGKMYLYGKGVEKNYSEALSLFLKSSEGRFDYQPDIAIGYMYANGLGVNRDLNRAEQWFLKSNEKLGSSQASNNLRILNKMKQNSCSSDTSSNISLCNELASSMTI